MITLELSNLNYLLCKVKKKIVEYLEHRMIVKYNNFLIVVLNAVFLIQTSVLHFTSLNLTICMRLEQCKTVNVCSIGIGSERMKTKNHVVYKMIFKYKKNQAWREFFNWKSKKKINLNSTFLKVYKEEIIQMT